jgi:thiol:disulfide interchange protein
MTVWASPAWAQLDILTGKPLNPANGALSAAGPESVVSVRAEFSAGAAGEPGTLSITADIESPWYTYALTQKPVLATPSEITMSASPDYQVMGEFRPELPPQLVRKDGESFEIHKDTVTWQAPLELKPGVDPQSVKVNGRVRIQVCNDHECLPPTRFDFVAAYAPPDASGPKPKSTPVFAPDTIHATLRGAIEPQPVAPGFSVKLVITAEPAQGWHVYELLPRDPNAPGSKPTLIVLTKTSGFRAERTVASEKVTEIPSEGPDLPAQRYHEGRVNWTTTIPIPKDTKPGQYPIEGLIGYQTCSGATCDIPHGARFQGTITVGDAGRGTAPLLFGEARYIEAAKAAAQRPSEIEPVIIPGSDPSLPLMIVFSLAGGFLLNFMPCVLPVIGLKILSFAEQAGRSRAHVLSLNVWYSLGLLSVFLVLATLASAVNLGLRDTDLGWGEQFSSTSFNVTMVAIVFVMALSFLGVWEIPIPGFVGSGKANDVAMREGAFGAFAKGVLTTVLATPCSGPLLSAVFGYTLKQQPPITYTIFACIGLGMASPYLLIGAFPNLIRFLPKPGAWMETFKQMMGFLMLGTIVFFFSFMNQEYLVATFAMMVGLWAGCWWIGRTSLVEPLGRKLAAWIQGSAVAGLIGLAAFTWLTPHESIIPWKGFSPSELARLTSEGHVVMVDFTADWCPNCKYNLRVAIETDEVRDLVARESIVPLLADWTNGAPEIKQMLGSLNRRAIPLLAIFPAEKGSAPILLDGILTKQNVLEALQQAAGKGSSSKLTATLP